jgi:hypothetical protein
MRTICVAGAMSRAGKTAFSAKLLARLPGWYACKVTTCLERPGQPCPRGNEDGCGVCGRLSRPYEIDEEPGGPETAAKDTGRLRAAGAARVLWVRTRPEALDTSIRRALEMLRDARGPPEGNHVLECSTDVAAGVSPAAP